MHRKCALLLFASLWFQSALHSASHLAPLPFLSHVVSVNRSPLKSYVSECTVVTRRWLRRDNFLLGGTHSDLLLGGETWGQHSICYPPCLQERGRFSRPQAACSSSWSARTAYCDPVSLGPIRPHRFVFGILWFLGVKGCLESLPPGLLVEISDGECGRRRPGAGVGWAFSRRHLCNEWPCSNLAEEAAGSIAAHATWGGVGKALQCSAGKWILGLEREGNQTHTSYIPNQTSGTY